MTQDLDIVKCIRKLAGDNNINGLNVPHDDISIDKVNTHLLFDVYKVNVPSKGLNYTAKKGNKEKPASVVEAYLTREHVASKCIAEVIGPVLPQILAYDTDCLMAIHEDLTVYHTLSLRIIDQSKVDHGLTCKIARLLAQLHNIRDNKDRNIGDKFVATPASNLLMEHVFVRTFLVDDLNPDLNPDLLKSARSILNDTTFSARITDVRQMYVSNVESIIHGNIKMNNILVSDQQDIKFADFGYAHLGPGTHDVGGLVAQYVIAYYVHLLTKQDNNSHRQTAYCVLEAIRKTVDVYTEERRASSGYEDIERKISEMSAFAGVQLIEQALNVADSAQPYLTDGVRQSILEAGWRLVSKYRAIHNTGRMLLIGLQLC